jgi:heavy metal sensor kinase
MNMRYFGSRPVAIKVRLAGWYFVLMVIAMSALSALALAGLEHSIRSTVDEQLVERVKLIQKIMLAAPASQSELETELRESFTPDSREELIQISDEQGNRVFQSTWLQNRTLLSAESTAKVQRKRYPFFKTKIDGVPFHGMIATVNVGRHSYTVRVAQNMDDFAEAISRFRHLLLAVVPALLVAASLGGYWISRRALAPVDEITRAAQRISGTNLSSRLAVPDSGDELARLAETLNAMLERIDLGVKQIAQFTADASHELRTPITLMRTRVELALRRPRSAEENQQTIEQLYSEVVRTSELVERLMMLARADSGASLMRMEDVEIVVLVQDVLAQTSVLALQKHLELKAQLNISTLWVRGDARYLRQLFMILIDNAVKYTPSPGIITVSLDACNGFARVSFSDTGIGIEDEDLKNIFNRFYRADKARSRETGGAGLGLAIGRWIAESHHGTLTAESKSGVGSNFLVTLPMENNHTFAPALMR